MDRILVAALFTGLLAQAQIPDFKPPTPLFEATIRNDAGTARKLLREGADPNEGRFYGFPAIMLAIVNSNQPIVEAMLDGGADPKITDGSGSTTLMWAVGNEAANLALVEALLKRGVDPNARNKMGETALTWAMRRGDMRTIEALKAYGASDAEAIGKSVDKAVALLQKSGPEFVKVSGCVSCHHQSLPQMAYGAARERGYRVDSAVAEQQTKAVMAMFRPIREQMEKGAINLPNPGISVSYSLLGLAAEGYPGDEVTRAMTRVIERTQLPDGSFAILPARPPLEASMFTSTALSARALSIYGRDCEERIRNARQWLLQAIPVTNEDRAMKVLGLAWTGAPAADVERAVAELRSTQRADGGWAQRDNVETDAYATGQAMVALYEAGAAPDSDKAYQSGVAYLMRTQLADGSWLVRTRSHPLQPLKDSGFPHGRDQWISAAGTSWAAMALALSQPKLGVPTSSAGAE